MNKKTKDRKIKLKKETVMTLTTAQLAAVVSGCVTTSWTSDEQANGTERNC